MSTNNYIEPGSEQFKRLQERYQAILAGYDCLQSIVKVEMAEKSLDLVTAMPYIMAEFFVGVLLLGVVVASREIPAHISVGPVAVLSFALAYITQGLVSAFYSSAPKKEMMNSLRGKMATVSSEAKSITCQSGESQCNLLRQLTSEFIDCAQSVEKVVGRQVEYKYI